MFSENELCTLDILYYICQILKTKCIVSLRDKKKGSQLMVPSVSQHRNCLKMFTGQVQSAEKTLLAALWEMCSYTTTYCKEDCTLSFSP